MFPPHLPQKQEVSSMLIAQEEAYSMAEIFFLFYFAFKSFVFIVFVYIILTPRVEGRGVKKDFFWWKKHKGEKISLRLDTLGLEEN